MNKEELFRWMLKFLLTYMDVIGDNRKHVGGAGWLRVLTPPSNPPVNGGRVLGRGDGTTL